MRLNTALLGLSLLSLAGCLHYPPRPLDPAAAARRLSQRSLADPGLKRFVEQLSRQPPAVWPPPAWGLSELTLAAFYFHPDLEVARARWEEAQASRRTASQRSNPALTAGPGYNTSAGTPSPWILSFVLDLTLETAGKRGARQDQAAHLAEAAWLEIAAVAWQVRSRVRQQLAALLAALETSRLLEQQQELQEENTRRTEQRHAAGAVSAYERTQARLAASQSRLAWRDAQRLAAEARVHLAAAVGVAPEALDHLELSFDGLDTPLPEASLAEARTRALVNRADLLAALAEYAAAEAGLRLEIARQYPDLHLGPGYELDQGDDKWSLALNLPLPLLHGNRGPIAEAEARRAAAAARFEVLQLRVVESVASALANYRALLSKKADAEAMQAAAREQVRREESLIDAGERSAADLVATRLDSSATRLAYLVVLSEARLALGVLEDAVQSPLGLPPRAWQETPQAMSATDEGADL